MLYAFLALRFSYETEGIAAFFQSNLAGPDLGHVVQSIWKFLIYTEIARDLVTSIERKPAHYLRSQEEVEIYEFIARNIPNIRVDFAERLRSVMSELISLGHTEPLALNSAKISELLHISIMADLRNLLGKVLGKREKVVVLIDNLDKGWGNQPYLSNLSDFILGLLHAAPSIADEMSKSGVEWRSIQFSLLVFLRSDIFEYIMSKTSERDKIQSTHIKWNERELLRRVIEQRFLVSSGAIRTPQEVWSTFFCETVCGATPDEYILSRSIPRPRDVIFWFKYALNSAINRRHERIEKDDIITSEQDYSQHAVSSLIAEGLPIYPGFDEFIYGLSGEKSILTYQ